MSDWLEACLRRKRSKNEKKGNVVLEHLMMFQRKRVYLTLSFKYLTQIESSIRGLSSAHPKVLVA